MSPSSLSPEHLTRLDDVGTATLRSQVLLAAVHHGSLTPLEAARLVLRHQNERLAAKAESDAQVPPFRWFVTTGQGVLAGVILGGGAALVLGPDKSSPYLLPAGVTIGAGIGGIIGLAIGQLKEVDVALKANKVASIATGISQRKELLDLAATLPPDAVELIYAQAVTGLTLQPPITPK